MISGVQEALISGWYSVDIRLLNSVKTWLFSNFSLSDDCPLISGKYLVISSRYFLIFCWNLSDISLKFGPFPLGIRLLYRRYPVDILISGVQISSKVLLLGFPFFLSWPLCFVHLQGVTTHDIRCAKGLDIRLISLISTCWFWSKHGCFPRFFKFFTISHLCSLISG